jgi:hypothetical protein
MARYTMVARSAVELSIIESSAKTGHGYLGL